MIVGYWSKGQPLDAARHRDEYRDDYSHRITPQEHLFPGFSQMEGAFPQDGYFSLCQSAMYRNHLNVPPPHGNAFTMAPPRGDRCIKCFLLAADIHGAIVDSSPPHPRVVVYRRALASLAVAVNGRPCFCRLDERIAADPAAIHSEQCRDLRALLETPHPVDLIAPLEIPS